MVGNGSGIFDTQRSLNGDVLIFQGLAQFIRHDFTNPFDVFPETHAVFLDVNVTDLRQKVIENAALFRNIVNLHECGNLYV